MSMTRRELLVGSMAFGAAFAGVGGAGASVPAVGTPARPRKPRLRIGVLADTHLDGCAPAVQKLERALTAFRRGRR